jgi:periplasmic protein TonB
MGGGPSSVGRPETMSGPVRVGGNIAPPDVVKKVPPVYPAEAQQAGIKGEVILEVTIAENGTVAGARILRSIPLLDDAAVEAVKQWEYTPTYVNGVPRRVVMTVTVAFPPQ